MTDDALEIDFASQLDRQLAAARSELKQPYNGRWTWFKRRWRGQRRLSQLESTRPVALIDYARARIAISKISRSLKRTRRARVFRLWVGIIFAVLVALVRRYGWIMLTLFLLVGVPYAAWRLYPFFDELFQNEPANPLPETFYPFPMPTDPSGKGPF